MSRFWNVRSCPVMRRTPWAAIACLFFFGGSSNAQFVEPGVTVIHNLTDTGGQFGWAVADLADIDNPPDGVTDFIIPNPNLNTVRVISGATGLDIHVLTPPSGSFFGNAVGDAGDVNNDGVHDIIVGTPGPGVGLDPGRTFVFSGADGSLLHTFLGEAARDGMGSAVSGAGDINDDDHDDVVTCASGNDAAFAGAGRCYVHSGIDGSLLRTHDGAHAAAGFGAGVARAGDINQDGYDEIIVGSPGANPNNDGKAYVYSGIDGSLLFDTSSDAGGVSYGQFFVDGVGDVNNDGTLDVWVGDFGAPGGGKGYLYSGADGSLIRKFTRGLNAGLGTGGQFVGDVNGDGYADALVGLWTSPEGGPVGAGKAIVYSGRTGSILREITCNIGGHTFGFDTVGVGDVNGDGFTDFLISAASQTRVYVIAGTDLSCGTIPGTPTPHISGVAANRYLRLQPGSPGMQTAVRVRLTNLNGFGGFNGQVRYLGPPSNHSDNTTPPSTFKGSKLQCTPHFRDWGAEGTVHVYGAEIVPGSTYEVQQIGTVCGVAVEDGYSDALSLTTQKWGDVVAPFGVGQPTFADISAVVGKFQGSATAVVKSLAQLQPNVPDPSAGINFADISAAVSSFQGASYSFTGPSACP